MNILLYDVIFLREDDREYIPSLVDRIPDGMIVTQPFS